MEAKDYITILGIVLTFVVSVYNAYKTFMNGKKTTFINTVTASRIKWIESLRTDMSTFTGLVYAFTWANKEDEKNIQEIVFKANCLGDKIRLSLNSRGEREKSILKLLAELSSNISNAEVLKDRYDKLIVETQILLKEEWERVKKESIVGDLTSNISDNPIENFKIWFKNIF